AALSSSLLSPSLFLLDFFSTDPATPVIYTLSLHDALPIFHGGQRFRPIGSCAHSHIRLAGGDVELVDRAQDLVRVLADHGGPFRSEEHTSELQSRFDLVCRLLLEKKNILYMNEFTTDDHLT